MTSERWHREDEGIFDEVTSRACANRKTWIDIFLDDAASLPSHSLNYKLIFSLRFPGLSLMRPGVRLDYFDTV